MAKHLMPSSPTPAPGRSHPALGAARYLAGFLALMMLFTLLSRAADELTIPRVRLTKATDGTIDRTITGFGKAEALSAQAILTQPGVRVAGISASTGSWVEAGAPLFTLDTGDLSDKLSSAREALERQDMDISDQASREAIESQERALSIARAGEDYAAAQKNAEQELSRAGGALEQAKATLSAFPPPAGDLAELEAKCAQLDSELQAAQAELERLEAMENLEVTPPSQPDSGPESQPETEVTPSPLEAAREKVAAAQSAKEQAERELEAYRNAAAQYKQLQDAVTLAQEAYEQTAVSQESILRTAARQAEDAERPRAQDSSGKKAQLERERQAQQVRELEELLEAGGLVRAPFDGTVTEIRLTVGSPTPDGTAMLLSGQENGCVFTAQVSAEQEKYLAPGDEAVIKPGGRQKNIEGLRIESVAPSAADGLVDVSLRLPGGSLTAGTAAELDVRRKSGNYPCLVPLSALHEEGGKFFLLVVQEKAGFLGTELTAARKDVVVLEKNETYAAIEPGALERGQGFIDYSSKPVSVGDRIRLEAS